MLTTVAWRNIWRHKKRSLVIILSIVIGLAAGAFVNGVTWGMSEQRQNDAIQNEFSHIQIHRTEFKADPEPVYIIPQSDEVIRKAAQNENVKSVAGRVITNGMILTTGNSAGVKIIGIIPRDEIHVTGLDKKITDGTYLESEKQNQLLIGRTLAEKIKAKVKSRIVLTFTDAEGNVVSSSFRIAGIFKTGNDRTDANSVFVNKEDLATELLTGNDVHEITILLKSNEFLNQELVKFKNQLPGLTVESWREVAPEIGLLIDMVQVLSTIIMIIILFALAFGIVNIMLMAVLERTHEIGMMMALGMNRIRIFILILLETVMLVIIAIPFGILLSYIIISFFSSRGINLGLYGDALQSMGVANFIYPAVTLQQYGQIIIMVILTAIVASLIPARKALKINPAESIKT